MKNTNKYSPFLQIGNNCLCIENFQNFRKNEIYVINNIYVKGDIQYLTLSPKKDINGTSYFIDNVPLGDFYKYFYRIKIFETAKESLQTINLLQKNTQTDSSFKDSVNHPAHYNWLKDKCGIEVIDLVRYMDFNLGNALKYILRAGHKSEKGMSDKDKTIEDLKKAIWYIEDKIKMLQDE